MLDSVDDPHSLKSELYGASMNACGDLQSSIAYIQVRKEKLTFMGCKFASELVHVFARGLHPIFQPMRAEFIVRPPESIEDARNSKGS